MKTHETQLFMFPLHFNIPSLLLETKVRNERERDRKCPSGHNEVQICRMILLATKAVKN